MKRTLSKEEEERIIDFRHDMHVHPELSHEELETSAKIKAFLESLPGVEILPFREGKSGVVARVKGKAAGKDTVNGRPPEVALRVDIDALPKTEQSQVPFKSQVEGKMHACGHDFHTASLLGTAILLSETRQDWHGTADLVFQDAEEASDGASGMLEDGLLDLVHPDVFFGLHNRPEVEYGNVVCHKGAIMTAKSNFAITIEGKTAHGASPQYGADAIVCASAIVMGLQTAVSRASDPRDCVVLTVGSMHGGSQENIICDKVVLKGSARSLDDAAKERAVKKMEDLVQGISAAYGCRPKIEYTQVNPMVYNGPKMYQLAKKAAQAAVGEGHVVDARPSMASEDFSNFMAKVPSFFYWIGSGTPGETSYPWHSEKFHADDRGIRAGAETMFEAALYSFQDPDVLAGTLKPGS